MAKTLVLLKKGSSRVSAGHTWNGLDGRSEVLPTQAGMGGCRVSRALDGGPQCRMSNLRNYYINCHFSSNFHVYFKMVSCHM